MLRLEIGNMPSNRSPLNTVPSYVVADREINILITWCKQKVFKIHSKLAVCSKRVLFLHPHVNLQTTGHHLVNSKKWSILALLLSSCWQLEHHFLITEIKKNARPIASINHINSTDFSEAPAPFSNCTSHVLWWSMVCVWREAMWWSWTYAATAVFR